LRKDIIARNIGISKNLWFPQQPSWIIRLDNSLDRS
jgi:hypothetical protein